MRQRVEQALRELARLDAVGASGASRHNVLLSNFPPSDPIMKYVEFAYAHFGSEAAHTLMSAWKREDSSAQDR